MKIRFWVNGLLIISLLVLTACQQGKTPQDKSSQDQAESVKLTYDSVTAKKYGADDYGMKKYVFAFLKRGPNRDLSPEKARELQTDHLKNIERMAKEGKLVLAGPFMDKGDLRGIYIFNVENIEEAEQLTNTDPAIQAGSLIMELKEWYGSAALMALNDMHKTLQKKGITE